MSKGVFVIMLFLLVLFALGLLAFYSSTEGMVPKAEYEKLQKQVTELQGELTEAYAKVEQAQEEARMYQTQAQAASDEAEKWKAQASGIKAWSLPLTAAANVLLYLALLVLAVGATIVGVRWCWAAARRFEKSQRLQTPKNNSSHYPIPWDPNKFKDRGEWMRANRPDILQNR